MNNNGLSITSSPLAVLKTTLWANYYEDILNILGSTGIILPITDGNHGGVGATNTTIGEEQLVFTFNEALSAFDAVPTTRHITPVVPFNGIDEEADTPDNTYWSRGDASNDFAFSVGFWINLVDATSSSLMGKWDSGIEEWKVELDASDNLVLSQRDDSLSITVTRTSDTTISENTWVFLVVTSAGTGGATAMNGVTMYEDGSLLASTAANNGSYVAMENQTSLLDLAVIDGSNFFDGQMAGGPLGPFFTQKELSADEVARLYDVGRRALNV